MRKESNPENRHRKRLDIFVSLFLLYLPRNWGRRHSSIYFHYISSWQIIGNGENKLHTSRIKKEEACESKRVAQNGYSLSSGATKKLAV